MGHLIQHMEEGEKSLRDYASPRSEDFDMQKSESVLRATEYEIKPQTVVMKSPARDGSLAVLQLAAAPRDDEASGVAFLLCLTRMDLWMLFSAISA